MTHDLQWTRDWRTVLGKVPCLFRRTRGFSDLPAWFTKNALPCYCVLSTRVRSRIIMQWCGWTCNDVRLHALAWGPSISREKTGMQNWPPNSFSEPSVLIGKSSYSKNKVEPTSSFCCKVAWKSWAPTLKSNFATKSWGIWVLLII